MTSEPVREAEREPRWRGAAYLYFQYDVGISVDLERCRALRAAEPARIRQEHRAPSWFQFEPPPLQMSEAAEPLQVGALATEPRVDFVVYDFGVVSVSYRFPFTGSLRDLVEWSGRLQEDQPLWEASRARVEALLAAIAPAVQKPRLAEPTEDYRIFQLEWSGGLREQEQLLASQRLALAQILRGERVELSSDEIDQALQTPVRYGQDDVAWVDWQAALLVGSEWADVRSVLEFASCQLLEMRFLDRGLDEALDRSYESLTVERRPLFGSRRLGQELLRVSRLQVDAALLYERVINTLKLFGDQYLARVYQLASREFHLPEWNATILRKLETVDGIYQKLADRADVRRMEALEWIIILLIAVSLLLPFLGGH